ncbi:MAG: glycine hydroxymethyltransferase, partial [Sphaerochaetaceae bacterium]
MAQSPLLHAYLKKTPIEQVDSGFIAYLAALEQIASVTPMVASHIVQELADQRSHLKLIASENYSSLACQLAMGNLLTDKYAEGFAYHRFYAGCDNVDAIEDYACKQAQAL